MKIFLPLISLIALISLFVNFKLLNPSETVTKIADGDTFETDKGRYRLLGVDAPELNRCFGPEAKARLTELILNKPVELKEPKKEEFGRKMVLVYVNGQLINETMMREGFGQPDYSKNSKREVLTAASHEAKNNKTGLWSSCILPPKSSNSENPACQIKANIDSGTYEKFYHLPNCRHYHEVVLNLAFGDLWFCTEEEAQSAGFTKSKSCP